MATTVQFDSASLQNVNRVVTTAKHDSAPDRDLEILPLARGEGGVFVSDHYQSKIILVSGVIKASSQDNLETEIDTFKELLSRKNKNLDIEYAGSTRRYVAYSRLVSINRDFFHLNFAPYSVEFVAPAGIGKDVSVTAALNAVSADPTYTGAVTFTGSAEPKPLITLTFGAGWTSAYGIKFANTDKDEECIINYSAGFSNSDILEIDCEARKVELNDNEIPFYRVFPTFEIASNNIEITAGDIIDQVFDPSSKTETTDADIKAASEMRSTWKVCQGFTTSNTDETYQGLKLYLKKSYGTDDVYIEIQTDNGGVPSGSAVSNATFTIANGDIGASYDWIKVNSTNKFTLNANTVYWIVAKMANDNASTSVWWKTISGSEADYGRGHAADYDIGSAGWHHWPTADRGFQLLFGGKVDSPGGTLTLDIDYTRRYL